MLSVLYVVVWVIIGLNGAQLGVVTGPVTKTPEACLAIAEMPDNIHRLTGQMLFASPLGVRFSKIEPTCGVIEAPGKDA